MKAKFLIAIALAALTAGCSTTSAPSADFPNGKRHFEYVGSVEGCKVYVTDSSPDSRMYSVRCQTRYGTDPVAFHDPSGRCKASRFITRSISDFPKDEYRIRCKGTPAETLQLGGKPLSGPAMNVAPMPGRNIYLRTNKGWVRK